MDEKPPSPFKLSPEWLWARSGLPTSALPFIIEAWNTALEEAAESGEEHAGWAINYRGDANTQIRAELRREVQRIRELKAKARV